jgi:hypothetical protein
MVVAPAGTRCARCGRTSHIATPALRAGRGNRACKMRFEDAHRPIPRLAARCRAGRAVRVSRRDAALGGLGGPIERRLCAGFSVSPESAASGHPTDDDRFIWAAEKGSDRRWLRQWNQADRGTRSAWRAGGLGWYAGAVSDVARDLLPLSRVFAGTVAGLLAPRRLFPITVVVVPLLFLQRNYSYDAMALPIGMLMCAAFLLVAPTLWRYFFPLHGPRASRVSRAAPAGEPGARGGARS